MNRNVFVYRLFGFLILLALVTACAGPAQETQAPPAVEPTAAEPAAPTAVEPTAPEPTVPPPIEEPTAAPQEVIELTMWDIPESEPYTAWWTEYVAKFNAEHPNIQVTMEVFPTEVYKTKFVAALASNTLPDIFYQAPGPETQTAFREGKIKSLEGLLHKERWTEGAASQCSFDGKMVCMPLYLAPEYVYYNKNHFAQAGVDVQTWANPLQPTWDEFTAAAEALKAAGIPPIALGNKDNWPGIQWMWSFESRFGGNEAFYDAVSGAGAYNSPAFLKAAEYTRLLAEKDWLTPGYNGIGGADKYTLWTQEKGAMIWQGPWLLGYVPETAPEGFDYSFFIFPSFPDENPDYQGLIMAGVDALWISATSAHPEAAAEFLNGFADPEIAIDFAVKTQNVSVIKGVVPPAGQENEVIWQLGQVASQAPAYSPWWDISGLPPAVNDEMLNMSQGLFVGEISPQEFVDRLEAAAGR